MCLGRVDRKEEGWGGVDCFIGGVNGDTFGGLVMGF